VSAAPEPIRSYQRIFRPERRIYQVEGRVLPVPGGVPLRWLAYAVASLLAVLALGSGSGAVVLGLAAIAAAGGFGVGRGAGAALAAIGAVVAAWASGHLLALLDWPLRLIVLPAAVATLATQATPDGRRADRFALSWLALRLAPSRRSLGRPLPPAGEPRSLGGKVWVSPDERLPLLRRARVAGPAIVFFAAPVALRRAGLRGGRLLARPLDRGDEGQGQRPKRRAVLGEREALEVRP
jgi:hypothetical protein